MANHIAQMSPHTSIYPHPTKCLMIHILCELRQKLSFVGLCLVILKLYHYENKYHPTDRYTIYISFRELWKKNKVLKTPEIINPAGPSS